MRKSKRPAVLWAAAVVTVAIGVIGAGRVWDRVANDRPFVPDRPRREIGPIADVPASQVEDGFDYLWSRVPVGGGGWVTGLVAPADAGGVKYARTDVGGAYRWDPTAENWHELISTTSTSGFDHVPNDYVVESIAVAPNDPNVVYLSVGDDSMPEEGAPIKGEGRVLRTTDGGATWTTGLKRFFVSGNMSHRQRSDRLAVHPGNPDRVLLGTRTEGVWQSGDGGTTWSQIPLDTIGIGRMAAGDRAEPAGVSFVSFDPVPIGSEARAYVGLAGVGVFRSDDAGDSWKRIAEAPSASDAPFEGSVVDGKLLVAWKRTDNEGAGSLQRYDPKSDDWTVITPDQEASEWSVAADPSNPEHLIAADLAVTEGRLWRSLDGGAHWDVMDFSVSSPKIPWYEQKDMADWMSIGRLVLDPDTPGRLWFAEGLGVWRADDVFTTDQIDFFNESVGIDQTVVSEVVAPPGGDPVSVMADVQGFWHNDLKTYPTAPLIDPKFAGGTDVDYSGKNPEVMVWAGAEYQRYWDEDRPGRGAISRDRGRTWTELPNLSPDQFGGNIAVSATDPDNIVWVPSYYINPWEFTGRPRGVFSTKDGGATWTEKDGIDGSHRFHRLVWWFARQALAADKVDGGVFYLNDDEERFLVSTDGGNSWDSAAFAPPCKEANACHVHGQLRASPDHGGEVWASVGDDGLYRSRDRGASKWERLDGVDEVESFDFGAPMAGSDRPTVFLHGRVNGDPELGIWRSVDDGASWTLIGRTPLGVFKDINNVNGDMDVAGRVYVSFGGVGVVYGEAPAP